MLLFEYGQLKKTPDDAWTYGDLRRRGEDAAAQFGHHTQKVYGVVVDITESELLRLDQEEHPNYQRISLLVFHKTKWVLVWCYEYPEADFADMPRIKTGSFVP